MLPRVLTLSHVQHIARHTLAEIEVFGFGSLCVMVEGRCALSSYVTGQSPNTAGVCSPPAHVRWTETAAGVEARLGEVLIDRYAPDEPRGYPTLCKGRFTVDGERDYAIEEPTSLNTLAILPQLARCRRRGDQDRGPPAQPDLRRRGHARLARCDRPCRLVVALHGAAGLGRAAVALGRGPAADAGRLRAQLAMTETTVPTAAARRFGLSVGPLQYWWSRQATWAFYADVAESAADTVVLGEVVCSRRNEIKTEDWLALAADLATHGKTVVLATQALVAGEAELRTLRRLCEQAGFAVEAGDASALAVLAPLQPGTGRRLPFVIGPHVNVYNRPALQELAPLGASRWVPPLELALDAVACVNPPHDPVVGPAGAVVTEVFAFGRMPLAFSARCFTARHHRLKKDACDFRCRDDADGLLLAAGDGQPFLVLNGIQTQSAALHCLIGERDAMAAAGVARVRLSPCSGGFMRVLALFDAVLNAGAPVTDACAELDTLGLPGALVNGYAHRRPGMQAVAL